MTHLSTPEKALPNIPDPLYMLELGVTHLAGDKMLTGSRGVTQQLTQGIDPALSRPFTQWYSGGHLGEIGKTSLVLQGPASTAEKVTAVHRSAAMMATLGVVEAVASRPSADRSLGSSARFLDGVKATLRTGEVPDAAPHGPRGQESAFRVAKRARNFLDLYGTEADQLSDLFDEWGREWLGMFSETVYANPNPDKLLQGVRNMGVLASRMAGAAVLRGGRMPRAMEHLGAIGGIEDAASYPLGATSNGIHTYQTALIIEHGARGGLVRADSMRRTAERQEYAAMQNELHSGRQRRVAKTVAFFIVGMGKKRRGQQHLDDPRVLERLEKRVRGF
jgi:hypothetical protein